VWPQYVSYTSRQCSYSLFLKLISFLFVLNLIFQFCLSMSNFCRIKKVIKQIFMGGPFYCLQRVLLSCFSTIEESIAGKVVFGRLQFCQNFVICRTSIGSWSTLLSILKVKSLQSLISTRTNRRCCTYTTGRDRPKYACRSSPNLSNIVDERRRHWTQLWTRRI